jgi:hypothetical protein
MILEISKMKHIKNIQTILCLTQLTRLNASEVFPFMLFSHVQAFPNLRILGLDFNHVVLFILFVLFILNYQTKINNNNYL